MKRVFLSLPMSGRTDEQIKNTIFNEMIPVILENREQITDDDEEEIIFVDNFCMKAKEMAEMERQAREAVTPNLVYLGEALKKMATCDAVVFAEDIGDARGCMVELYVADKYNIPKFYLGTNYLGEKYMHHAKFKIINKGGKV